MTQLRAAALMASLLPGLGGCLLYTDEINEAPTVAIDAPSLTPFRGDRTSITARVTDDQDAPDRVEVTWVEVPGTCPKDEAAAPTFLASAQQGLEYTLRITGFGAVCLFVQAKDSAGATGPWRHKQFEGLNREPQATFEVSPTPGADGVLPLYSRVVLAAKAADDDGDLLKHQWELTGPDEPVTLAVCPGMSDGARRCFVPRKPGRYLVKLVVVEDRPAGALAPTPSQPQTRVLNVARDRPPCLELTDPPLHQDVVLIAPGTKRTFEVSSVADDGEPYPGPGENGETLFVWSIPKLGGQQLERTVLRGPSFEVGESLFGSTRPGDQFRVRVEVRDKLSDRELGAGLAGAPCADDEPVCRDSSGCRRWTTWRVQFHP